MQKQTQLLLESGSHSQEGSAAKAASKNPGSNARVSRCNPNDHSGHEDHEGNITSFDISFGTITQQQTSFPCITQSHPGMHELKMSAKSADLLIKQKRTSAVQVGFTIISRLMVAKSRVPAVQQCGHDFPIDSHWCPAWPDGNVIVLDVIRWEGHGELIDMHIYLTAPIRHTCVTRRANRRPDTCGNTSMAETKLKINECCDQSFGHVSPKCK